MSHPVNPHFVSWLEQHCQANAIETSLIQTLWSGYGACFRAALQPAGNSHLAAPLSAVVKCAVTPATHKHLSLIHI